MTQRATRVLLVCANPRGTDPLRTAEEERVLKESIQLSPHRSVTIEALHAATIDDLRRALLRENFDIVHFSGHGTRRGLVFEDPGGRLMLPSSEALASLLQRREVSTVLLNACYSLSVGRMNSIGIDYTIASPGAIADPAAIEFSRGFYDAIGAGREIPEAHDEGISCANLKGYSPKVILLRKGEEYIADDKAPEDTRNAEKDVERQTQSVLLGVALDTSGSMRASIRNDSGDTLSRLESARRALQRIGTSVQGELSRTDNPNQALADEFRMFTYAFGLRIGGTGDLISLFRASQQIDLKAEVESRRRRYEAEARREASGLGGLANLARGYGFGSVVNSVSEVARSQAERSIRERIVGEIAELLQRRSAAIGDSTVTAQEIAEIFEGGGGGVSLEDVEPLVYGTTPMSAVATEIASRFDRIGKEAEDGENRVLLVISDGEPTDGDPKTKFAEIRDSGVSIVSCFVTDDDIADPRVLVASSQPGWSSGALLMFEIASPIDENSPFARYLLGQGWAIEPEAKLFVQVNHSLVFEEFIRATGSHFSGAEVELLPEGR